MLLRKIINQGWVGVVEVGWESPAAPQPWPGTKAACPLLCGWERRSQV